MHSEDWSDWADAQADLSVRWAHTHFVGFVMSWLKWINENRQTYAQLSQVNVNSDFDFAFIFPSQ